MITGAMITGATLICLHVQNRYSAKGLLAEICLTAIIVFMPVNQVDTAFEYAVMFVCWINLGSVNSTGSATVICLCFVT